MKFSGRELSPLIETDWKIGDRGVPGAFLVTFSASKKSLAPGGETPHSRGVGAGSPHILSN